MSNPALIHPLDEITVNLKPLQRKTTKVRIHHLGPTTMHRMLRRIRNRYKPYLAEQTRSTARTKKRAFIKAMIGTCGIKTQIAENLGIHAITVAALLNRPDWADVRALYDQECERAWDKAEEVLHGCMDGSDKRLASEVARWVLARRRRKEYGDASTVKVVGGDQPGDMPVQMAVAHAVLPAQMMDLPPELKRQVLQHLDHKEDEAAAKEVEAELVGAEDVKESVEDDGKPDAEDNGDDE